MTSGFRGWGLVFPGCFVLRELLWCRFCGLVLGIWVLLVLMWV